MDTQNASFLPFPFFSWSQCWSKKPKQNNWSLKYSTSLMQNSPYPHAVSDLLPQGLSACALRPILKEFVLLLFYLLIIPCTMPLVNWIFQLVVLNFLTRCFSRWNASDPPWGGVLSFTFSPIQTLRRKVCSWCPETQNPWKTCGYSTVC